MFEKLAFVHLTYVAFQCGRSSALAISPSRTAKLTNVKFCRSLLGFLACHDEELNFGEDESSADFKIIKGSPRRPTHLSKPCLHVLLEDFSLNKAGKRNFCMKKPGSEYMRCFNHHVSTSLVRHQNLTASL